MTGCGGKVGGLAAVQVRLAQQQWGWWAFLWVERWSVKMSAITWKWFGEGERLVRCAEWQGRCGEASLERSSAPLVLPLSAIRAALALFALAHKLSPIVVFVDKPTFCPANAASTCRLPAGRCLR